MDISSICICRKKSKHHRIFEKKSQVPKSGSWTRLNYELNRVANWAEKEFWIAKKYVK